MAGLPGARIFASGGLDEYAIAGLVAQQVPIDAYGVGTKMSVSADGPFLDSAYKLVTYAGRPVMKLSSGKAPRPAPSRSTADRMAMSSRCGRSPRGRAWNPFSFRLCAAASAGTAASPWLRHRGGPPPTWRGCRPLRGHCAGAARPAPVPVHVSEQLQGLQDQLTHDLRR